MIISILSWAVVIIYLIALSVIFSYSMVQLNLVQKYLKLNKKTSSALPDSKCDLPFVTVQLPLYNEKYVVERLIDCVTSFDYPKSKFEIQILDDSTDETTDIITNLLQKDKFREFNIDLIRRPDRSGYKAGALKYGLSIARGKYVAIFDADFMPKADFLKRTIPHLENNDQLGVVQTRWGHLNEEYSVLTKMQAFGLNAHFRVEQTGRNLGKHFINFNGTAGVWRAQTIIDAGNWQSDTLTEDLDLSYRAQLKGWKFKYLEEVCSPAELPATMPAVKSQQFRWNKGAAECAVKNLGKVFRTDLPLSSKIHATAHLLNSSIFLVILVSGLASVPVLIIKNRVLQIDILFHIASVFLLSLLTLIVFYGISYFKDHSGNAKNVLKFIYSFPMFLAVSMGMSLHNSLAVLEGYMGKKTAFIRTPKFNIHNKSDAWKSNVYITRKVPAIAYVELLLAIYFLTGIACAVFFGDFVLLFFHLMLTCGFFFVFFTSVKHVVSATK